MSSLVLMIALVNTSAALGTEIRFHGLGDLPPADPHFSQAAGVSADGATVVGIANGVVGTNGYLGAYIAGEAFRWADTNGNGQSDPGEMVGLGDLDGGDTFSLGFGVSADGSVVVGIGASIHGPEAFRWADTNGNGQSDPGEMVGLGDLDGGVFDSIAVSIAADGSVIVGQGSSALGPEAFRWADTNGNGQSDPGEMVGLGDFDGGVFDSIAVSVAADGSVIVGRGSSALGAEAFRWADTNGNGQSDPGEMVGLGDLEGGYFWSAAWGVSADGSVVVGASDSANATPDVWPYPFPAEAFRWADTNGNGQSDPGEMIGLGDLEGGYFWSVATAVSEDALVVVGRSVSDDPTLYGSEAFIWDSANGMRSLRDILVSLSVPGVTGWTLYEASDISADGMTIVGPGINPDGEVEGWIVAVSCNDPFADHDGDADVDLEDFASFQRCFTGSGPADALFDPLVCRCSDWDRDNDVDQDDFMIFEGCMDGPGIPAFAACDD